MNNENNLKSKELYKTTLYILKILPMIMAFSYLLMLFLFNYVSDYLVAIPHILGTVLPMIIFLYLTSYVFKFCAFHRMFIHYYVFIDVLNVLDHYYAEFIPDKIVTIIHDTGTIVFIISTIITYIYKYKKDKCLTKCNKE